jgi:hypothetical protein
MHEAKPKVSFPLLCIHASAICRTLSQLIEITVKIIAKHHKLLYRSCPSGENWGFSFRKIINFLSEIQLKFSFRSKIGCGDFGEERVKLKGRKTCRRIIKVSQS